MPEMCDPILVTLMKKCNPRIVNPAMKMQPHPAAHPISLLLGSIPAGKF